MLPGNHTEVKWTNKRVQIWKPTLEFHLGFIIRFFGKGNIPSILTSLSLKNEAYFVFVNFEDFSSGTGLKDSLITSFFNSDVEVLSLVDSTTASASLNDFNGLTRFQIGSSRYEKVKNSSIRAHDIWDMVKPGPVYQEEYWKPAAR